MIYKAIIEHLGTLSHSSVSGLYGTTALLSRDWKSGATDGAEPAGPAARRHSFHVTESPGRLMGPNPRDLPLIRRTRDSHSVNFKDFPPNGFKSLQQSASLDEISQNMFIYGYDYSK
jgi:hypothetical protein